MWRKQSTKPSIECTRVWPTSHRPGSKGTYIVRLSRANRQRLKVKDGAYLKISYGKASVLARLSVDEKLDDETIRMDQTLRHAICLEKIMVGLGKKELIYDRDGDGKISHPIVIQRSNFRGPTLLARLFKQQYLICLVHHAIPRDMETPIARLTTQAMEVIGIQPGDKVLLITENNRKSLRCLPLSPETHLPLEKSMRKYFIPPCPDSAYQGLSLPWITIDWQTRLDLGLDPWLPIIVGRDPRHVLAWELGGVVAAVALSALGGAIVVPYFWLQLGIIITGLVVVLTFISIKIRSRI